jgi:hypothetical protein
LVNLDSGSLEVFRQYPILPQVIIPTSAMGDVVQLVDGGTATTIEKQAATGDDSTAIDIVGIFMGCSFTDPNTNQKVFSAKNGLLALLRLTQWHL